MKAIHSLFAAAAFVLAEPVQAGINDPEVIIYRFPGVSDDGGNAIAGVATVFHCTNFSGVTESVRFVTRQPSGALTTNFSFSVAHLGTVTVATHPTAAYGGTGNLGTGPVRGTTAIAATSTNIICTAMTIDAANPKPDGVALRGIRFSPVPESQE